MKDLAWIVHPVHSAWYTQIICALFAVQESFDRLLSIVYLNHTDIISGTFLVRHYKTKLKDGITYDSQCTLDTLNCHRDSDEIVGVAHDGECPIATPSPCPKCASLGSYIALRFSL